MTNVHLIGGVANNRVIDASERILKTGKIHVPATIRAEMGFAGDPESQVETKREVSTYTLTYINEQWYGLISPEMVTSKIVVPREIADRNSDDIQNRCLSQIMSAVEQKGLILRKDTVAYSIENNASDALVTIRVSALASHP